MADRSPYDALGGLDTASDLGGGAWAYDYDATVSGELRFDVESGRVWLDGGEQIYGLSTSPDDLEEIEPWSDALSSVTSPWSRDASGHVDLVEYPHGGTEVRSYGADGQLATVTLPHGTTLEYDIDVAGRVLERTGTDGSLITPHPGETSSTWARAARSNPARSRSASSLARSCGRIESRALMWS